MKGLGREGGTKTPSGFKAGMSTVVLTCGKLILDLDRTGDVAGNTEITDTLFDIPSLFDR